ncbi:thiamine pyrophosphate-binding protein [Streptosporangium sp. NPDC002607]
MSHFFVSRGTVVLNTRTSSVSELTVAEFLLEQLDALGVDAVFGIPGGNISAFIQALREHPKIKFIIASHEGGAAFMADGYARSTGKLGVCLVTAGPGALNALTGVASAHRDQVPLLVVGGQVRTDLFGLRALQDSSDLGTNMTAMYSHVSGFSTGLSDPGSFPRILSQAINVATGPRPCAVYLSVPADIARMPVGDEKAAVMVRRPGMELDPAEARRVLGALSQARRPLIFLGNGARQALRSNQSSFREIVHTLGVHVVTSVRAKGIFPESDDRCLGVLGTAGTERAAGYAAAGVDALLVIGSGLGEWATRSFDRKLAAVSSYFHVDLDPTVFGQFLKGGEHIQADAEVFLRGLRRELPGLGEVKQAPTLSPPSSRPTPVPLPRDSGAGVSPVAVMLALNDLLTGQDDLYIDMGNCTAWATHHLVIDPPTRIFYPCGLSSMGWSCGATVGGKIGDGGRVATALVGDGAFLMNGNEVRTAAKNRVGAIFVVLDDGYLGMVNHGEHAQNGGRFSLEDDFYGLGVVDLAQFSRALGADAYVVEEAEALREAMGEARSAAARWSRPQVVVVKTDYRVSPPYGERFTAVAGDA